LGNVCSTVGFPLNPSTTRNVGSQFFSEQAGCTTTADAPPSSTHPATAPAKARARRELEEGDLGREANMKLRVGG
jgi:hypothetical protein